MEAARVAVSLKPGTRKNVKRCPVLNLEAIEMVRGGPPRMREEAGDGNFKLQIKKNWAIFKAGKTDWPSIPYLLIPKYIYIYIFFF